MRSWPSLPSILLLSVIHGCASVPDTDGGSRNQAEAPAVLAVAYPSNAEMAAILVKLRDEQATSVADRFFNNSRAENFARLAASENDQLKRFVLSIQRSTELVNAGRASEAIPIMEDIVTRMDRGEFTLLPEQKLQLLHVLAICYVRLGEQANCLKHHTSVSCVFPIAAAAQHVEPMGSRKAVEVYTRILNEFPNDLKARWLMNVSYMTLGEHPGSVPAKWLIPSAAFGATEGFPRFANVAGELGVDVNALSGGICMEDFNNDGLLDLMTSSWSLKDQLRLFLRNADGSFTDRTTEAGLTGITGGLNMVHADYDNDGNMDVLVLRGAWLLSMDQPNSLLRNRGDGAFEDVTKAAGMLTYHPTQSGAWGDYDNDGDLDLYIGNESAERPHPCELYRNNGDGTFTDVAAQAGVTAMRYVKGVVWGDIDNDGRLDLYVSTMAADNMLFLNQGPDAQGQWTFKDTGKAAGVTKPFFSFPTCMFDFDNDGWLDLFASAYPTDRLGEFSSDVAAHYLGLPNQAESPRLYRNNRNGTFSDITAQAGLGQPLFTMGFNFGDLDNDGFPDLYLATGEPEFASIIPNRVFHNEGDGRFRDVTTAGGFGNLQKGHAVAFGDLDNDGDQDIYAVLGGAYEGDVFPNELFENPHNELGRSWTTLLLQGVQSNRNAIGARIRVTVETPNGKRDFHSTVCTGGSFGSSSLRQEMGLGDATGIAQVEVIWPATGAKQIFTDVPLNKAVRLVEGQPKGEVVPWPLVKLKGADNAPAHHHHPG